MVVSVTGKSDAAIEVGRSTAVVVSAGIVKASVAGGVVGSVAGRVVNGSAMGSVHANIPATF